MTTFSTLLRLALCMPVVLATQAHAQIEGTLFTSPDERVYLDYLRDEFLRNSAQQGFDIEEAAIPEIPEETAPAAAGPAEYSFGGVLTRRNGQHSIWLNGTLIPEQDLPEGFRLVESDGVVSLRIVQDGDTHMLRPGQTVNVVSGLVHEGSRSSNSDVPVRADATTTTAPSESSDATTNSAATSDASDLGEIVPDTADGEATFADPVSSLADRLAELTPEQQDELANLLEARTEASPDGTGNASE